MKDFNFKIIAIVLGLFVSIIIFFVCLGFGYNNRAIGLEEQVNTSKAAVTVKEKRRADLLVNLIDTAKSYNNYEQSTMTKIIEARSKAISGKVDEAQLMINAVAEQYPELKSQDNYKYIMNELSITENLIAESRTAYNNVVKEYNRFVRRFPSSMFLGITGYEKQNFKYLEYSGLEDSPKDLWK